MSAQTRYGYSAPIGAPGGIVDLAPYAIDTFLNEEATGTLAFGMGVVQGTTPGTNVKLPTSTSTAATFEGITVNNRTTEFDLEGNVRVRKGASVGVMRYGRIYGRVVDGVTTAYGDAVYLVIDGDNAGMFTNTASSDEGSATVAVKGRFLGTVDTSAEVAVIELFNTAQA